jgi:DNA-binding beta-propeller fold protein YncE
MMSFLYVLLGWQLAAAAPIAYVVQGLESPDSETPIGVIATFDTATNTYIWGEGVPWPPNFSPLALVFSPDAKTGYTAGVGLTPTSGYQAQLRTFDTALNQFVGTTINLQDSAPNESWAHFITIHPNGRFVYVVTHESINSIFQNPQLWVIDSATKAPVGHIQFDPSLGSVQDMKIAPDGSRLYLSMQFPTPPLSSTTLDTSKGVIVIIDTATNVISGAPIEIDLFAGTIALNGDGTKLYVPTAHLEPQPGNLVAALAIVDTFNRTVRQISPPAPMGPMVLAPDGRFLWTSNRRVASIDTVTDTLVKSFPAAGEFDSQLVFRPDGKILYDLFPQRTASSISIIDPEAGTQLGFITVGAGARQIVIAAPLASPPPPPVFPHTNGLDEFNRADGKLGGNWSGASERRDYRIVAQQLDVRDGGRAYWQAQSFGIDQEAFVTLTEVDRDATVQGLILKAQGGSPSAEPQVRYGEIDVVYDARNACVRVVSFLPRAKQGAVYAPIAQPFADGDQLGARIKSNGSVEVYRNGALIGTVTLSSADQAFFNHNGGRIGLRFGNGAGDAVLDNFGGGNAP